MPASRFKNAFAVFVFGVEMWLLGVLLLLITPLVFVGLVDEKRFNSIVQSFMTPWHVRRMQRVSQGS